MSCSGCNDKQCDASTCCKHSLGEHIIKEMVNAKFDAMWDRFAEDCNVERAATHGPSPIASALPLLEQLKELEKQSVPFRPAYLVMPPEWVSHMPMTTFTDASESNYASARMDFRVFQDYGVRVRPHSLIIYGDIGGSDPYVTPVVWKDVEQPARPSVLIWCVVVAFLCWLLCAAAGLL